MSLVSRIRRMFWCNGGRTAGVETALLDGSSRRALAIDKVFRPTSLAVDLPVQRLYIADARTNSIQFCTYDGLHCHRVVADSEVLAGFSLSFTSVFSNILCCFLF